MEGTGGKTLATDHRDVPNRWPSIKPGTWKIQEHSGTSNNYHNYEKKMPKIKTWVCLRDHSVVPLHLCPIVADMSSDIM